VAEQLMQPATLNAQDIAQRIPHGDSMSLLDSVIAWDQHTIHCQSNSYTRAENPLRESGSLASVTLIEYAAQAAAVHASLLNTGLGNDRPAYLAAVKSLSLETADIPLQEAPLSIEAKAELHNPGGAVYYFTASINEMILAQGKLILAQP